MPLLKGNAYIADEWTLLDDAAPVPAQGKFIISASRFLSAAAALAQHHPRLGLVVANTDRVEALEKHLKHLGLIALTFPAFGDGRSYSIARQLRLAGFKGILRAQGNVLPDQLQFMVQVGFDEFQVTDRFSLEVWQQAARQMSLAYQRGLYRKAGEDEILTARHASERKHVH